MQSPQRRALLPRICVLVFPLALIASAGNAADLVPTGIGQSLFPLLKERGQDIARVTMETGLYHLELRHQGDTWVAVDRGDYPVLPGPIEGILAAVAALPASELVTTEPADYATYDVDDPGPGSVSVRITVATAADELLADVIVGAPGLTTGSPPRGGTFVRRGDEAEVWLAEGYVTVPRFLSQWFAPVANVRGPDVARVSILSGDRLLLTAEKTDFDTGTYAVAALDPELGLLAEAHINQDAIRAMAQAVVVIAPEDVLPREAVFVAPDARTVRFEMRDGLRLDFTFGDLAGSVWVLVNAEAGATAGAEAVATAAAIRAAAEHWALSLPGINVATLTQDLALMYTIPRASEGY